MKYHYEVRVTPKAAIEAIEAINKSMEYFTGEGNDWVDYSTTLFTYSLTVNKELTPKELEKGERFVAEEVRKIYPVFQEYGAIKIKLMSIDK